MRKVTLYIARQPGDNVCFTVALKSLHDQYPGEYETAVASHFPDCWLHNPHVVPRRSCREAVIPIDYVEQIKRANTTGQSFPDAYVEDLANKLGITLEPTTTKPMLYLTDRERRFAHDLPARYVVIAAGHKDDIPLKAWHGYAELARSLTGIVPIVQIGRKEDNQPTLPGAISLVGKTDLRQLFAVVARATAGVGAVTLLQHVCPAFDVPYVCLVGGREAATWVNTYPLQTTLHTIGQLDCCEHGGCWLRKFDDCKHLTDGIGACMKSISVEQVRNALLALV